MKKNLLFFVVLFIINNNAFAQDCDTEGRYLQAIFPNIDSTTVLYGQNTTIGGVDTPLDMEIFYPSNDNATNRPVLIMAHGGFFIEGNRESMSEICSAVAHTGYVTASISYRLMDLPLDDIFNIPDSIDMLDEVVKSVSDMKSAIRYLKYTAANGNPYAIDTNAIFIGGGSAGGIAAVNAAFLDATDDIPQHIEDAIEDNGGFGGNTDHPTTSTMGHSTEVLGVVNLSGGIARKAWLQGNAGVSIVNVHGDMDETVPYEGGLTKIVVVENVFEIDLLYIDGGYNIHQEATSLGVNSYLYTVVGGGHSEFYSETDTVLNLIDFTLEKLYPLICTQTNIENISDVTGIKIQPTVSNQSFQLSWDAEKVLDQVQVVDMMGRNVWTGNVLNNTQNMEINCNKWAKGIYTIIVQGEGRIFNQRVVVE